MKLSVAICTWNRAELLRDTLQSLVRMNPIDSFEWELIVVENNCTDTTRSVLRSFDSLLPLRVVSEQRQGHSYARNRAVAESVGEFIVWTDDDVLVSRDWLAAYAEAISTYADASFFGGPIELKFQGQLPRWHRENPAICDAIHARRQLGNDTIQLGPDALPFGANFATRRSVQQEFQFSHHFGRVAGDVRGYDEIDVLTRMASVGHVGYWIPNSVVHHVIPAERLTTDYVYDYFFGQGQTWIRRGICHPTTRHLQQGIRRHRLGYLLGCFSVSTRRWFWHLTKLANLKGQLDQLNRQRQGVEVGDKT